MSSRPRDSGDSLPARLRALARRCPEPAIRTISSRGQIALGKEFAGQRALVEEIEPGVWMIKVGEFIPANERWLHEPEVKATLDRALRWAADSPPAETDLADLRRCIEQ